METQTYAEIETNMKTETPGNDKSEDNSDWDSDDELPLAAFLSPFVPTVKNIRFIKSTNNVVVQTPFVEFS